MHTSYSVILTGRDLYRKLAPEDRCIGALRLVTSCNGDVEPILRAVAAALHFKAVDEHGNMFPADVEFHAAIDKQGLRSVLQTHCQLNQPEDTPLVDQILTEYEVMKG